MPGDNTSEFLIAEYNALRAEILALEERATNIQIAGLTGIPTLLAAGDYWHLSFLIVFGPVIIVVAALMLIFLQDSIMREGTYIKDCIEPHFLGGTGGWESFLEKKPEQQDNGKERREDRRRVEKRARLSVIIAFAFYYLFSLIPAYRETLKYGRALSLILMTTYIVALVWAFIFIWKNFPKGTAVASKKNN